MLMKGKHSDKNTFRVVTQRKKCAGTVARIGNPGKFPEKSIRAKMLQLSGALGSAQRTSEFPAVVGGIFS